MIYMAGARFSRTGVPGIRIEDLPLTRSIRWRLYVYRVCGHNMAADDGLLVYLRLYSVLIFLVSPPSVQCFPDVRTDRVGTRDLGEVFNDLLFFFYPRASLTPHADPVRLYSINNPPAWDLEHGMACGSISTLGFSGFSLHADQQNKLLKLGGGHR